MKSGIEPPPKTLLNLTINMIDALSVEFVLVTNMKLFNSFKKRWFLDEEYGPGESWGGEDHHNYMGNQGLGPISSAGGCLVFTSPNHHHSDLKKG